MSDECELCRADRAPIWRGSSTLVWRDGRDVLVGPRRHVAALDALSDVERLELWTALSVATGLAPSSDATKLELLEGAHFAIRVLQPDETTLTDGWRHPLGPKLLRDIAGATNIDVAVAFAWESGINRVYPRLEECQERGGRVRMIIGDYADATEPRALRRLLDLDEPDTRVELRVFESALARTSFHPKAYLISSAAGASVAYVGSSNLSQRALEGGVEWNVRLTNPTGVRKAFDAFEALFRHPATRPLTHRWIDAYERRRARGASHVLVDVGEPEPPPPRFEPHPIQRDALEALDKTRRAGNRAGLVVLATGLGKTWLSAFDSEPFARVLFVAHREEILRQARNTFRAVRRDDTLGMHLGPEKEHGANVLFASVQTLSKPDNLACFPPGHFDYVIVDEFHHASARTYRRIIRHFEPKFLLGLTATPERTDGGDLLALCDENLVYRCDLGMGIARDRLCPFRYFGVPDDIDYAQIPWRSSRFDEDALTRAAATTARANNALEQWRERGGERTLGFCVSRRHADFMREHFRAAGVRCASVHSGPTSDGRMEALAQLEAGELEVLFAVDMFNEGLDVRSIDTVLMLRPTESKVLWLQQIGRGLRKADGKPHLTIIDYIGNHRVFLNKPAALLAALGIEASGREVISYFREQKYELPPGCEITYEVEALDILASLFSRAKPVEALEAWYNDFREQNGERPTALQAYRAGHDPRATQQDHEDWLGFVRDMGDLDAAQLRAREAAQGLLAALATAPMPNPEPLVVVEALLAARAVPGRAPRAAVLEACRRIVERSAVLRNEVRPDSDMLARVERAWELIRGDDDALEVNLELAPSDRDVLEDLVAELLEWRLTRYIDDRRGKTRFKVLRNSDGKTYLKLDRSRHDLPEGWVTVDAGKRTYRAQFTDDQVEALRPEGSEADALDGLLRKWFGPDAGKRGTNFSVVHEAKPDGSYRWLPAFYGDPKTGIPVRDARGEPLDARFNVEELDDRSVTIIFMSRNKGRNDEYNAGLERILACLASRRLLVDRVAVESARTQHLPLPERTLELDEHPYPIAPHGVDDLTALRRQLGRAMAQLGRADGAKGGGNMNKRIRIWVRGVASETLHALIGGLGKP